MTLIELGSPGAVSDFIQSHSNVVITFSAHWCGPCNASKPALMELASRYASDVTMDIKMGIVYESDLGESIHLYRIRAFPTYVLFQGQREQNRVEGANLVKVEQMIRDGGCQRTGGATLSDGATTPLSPEEARLQRLAKLGAAGDTAPAAAEDPATQDVEMKDASEETSFDPTANLSEEAIKTLTESMGFTLIRAQKGLINGNNTVEGAVEWLMQHQDDPDIDDPISSTGEKAMSYKCNECGKILSNMANLELHANKTGHSDFEESTQSVKPLTEEEKAAKIAEIKELLKKKRAEREEAEKVDEVEREKQRRFMAKEMAKTKEQLEIEQRKREAEARKREKEAFKRERERLRAELARDKLERKSHGGKLTSKLGVQGYNPNVLQYDAEGGEAAAVEQHHEKKKIKADASKIDDYIKKISSYRAGGDGGKCLKVLKAYVGNVVDSPDEEKFKTIKMDNNAFKTKVKPFVGAKNLLLAVGFKQAEGADSLVLQGDADRKLLADTKEKLEKAIIEYG